MWGVGSDGSVPPAVAAGLVRMKLTSYRDKDRTHLRDLIGVGLLDDSWLPRLSAELSARLRHILLTPEG